MQFARLVEAGHADETTNAEKYEAAPTHNGIEFGRPPADFRIERHKQTAEREDHGAKGDPAIRLS